MSANRKAWFPVVLIVLVVGFLVVRTLRNPQGTAPGEADRSASTQAPSARPPLPDSLRGQRAISSVQRAKLVLKERGYWDGPIDSNYDPKLAEALKRFQADAGMKPTGHLDERTYAALGIELRKSKR